MDPDHDLEALNRDQLVAGQCFKITIGVHVTAPRLRGVQVSIFTYSKSPGLLSMPTFGGEIQGA